MERMSHFCRQWRLKPSASKTITSVFHLHNTSATRELSVFLDGQRLRHECHGHPTYLGVTLDRTLSNREHLTKTVLALCYSAAEYCAPVWSRSAHTSQVDVQLISTMRLISLKLSVLYLSYGFQCSPALNRQPYEKRLTLTSWWRKSSNTTVGQSNLISLAHHLCD